MKEQKYVNFKLFKYQNCDEMLDEIERLKTKFPNAHGVACQSTKSKMRCVYGLTCVICLDKEVSEESLFVGKNDSLYTLSNFFDETNFGEGIQVVLAGKTYEIKDEIKLAGGKFRGDHWTIPLERADEFYKKVEV